MYLRLLQAVVEEFKHNTDASDPFAWQPQTPARARASALLAACAVLAAQDKQLSAPEALSPRPTGQQPPELCPVKQQRQQQRQQEQMDAVRQYQLQQSPAKKADNASMVAVPAPMQAGGDRPSVAACDERPSQAQGMDARAPDQASAMEVDLELSAEEPATPPGSPSCERAKPPADAFTTPARQMLRGSSVEFPALEQGASPAPTPVLCTPAGKWRPLWKKLHPLCLDFQGPSEQVCPSLSQRASVQGSEAQLVILTHKEPEQEALFLACRGIWTLIWQHAYVGRIVPAVLRSLIKGCTCSEHQIGAERQGISLSDREIVCAASRAVPRPRGPVCRGNPCTGAAALFRGHAAVAGARACGRCSRAGVCRLQGPPRPGGTPP